MQAAAGKRKRKRGVALVVGVAALVAVIPALGLAIDVGILYGVKSKLQSAVDGAALAAARSLNLGQTDADQADSARANARNWFSANFPRNYMNVANATMNIIYIGSNPPAPYTSNPQVRHVILEGEAITPTIFMRWFGMNQVTVRAGGHAARRDVVVMMVLDRSGSMGTHTDPSSGCYAMKNAAKIFTGQFAANRDRIGLVLYSDTVQQAIAPAQTFQTTLGYIDRGGVSHSGLIDTITCSGGTDISTGLSVGAEGVQATNLPGALNVIMFMTDGLPNFMALDYVQPRGPGYAATGLTTTSGCRDALGRTQASGANFVTNPPSWTPGVTFSNYFPGSTRVIPAGMIGSIGTNDNLSGNFGIWNYWLASPPTPLPSGVLSSTRAPGCSFPSTSNPNSDMRYLPETDIFGNSLTQTAFRTPISRVSGYIDSTSNTNRQRGAFNASDHAALKARTHGTIPSYIFVVGLDTGVDFAFLQRVANDPNGDLFNTPPYYSAVTNQPTQPQGTFIYSSVPSQLSQAFLQISSMILRLSE